METFQVISSGGGGGGAAPELPLGPGDIFVTGGGGGSGATCVVTFEVPFPLGGTQHIYTGVVGNGGGGGIAIDNDNDGEKGQDTIFVGPCRTSSSSIVNRTITAGGGEGGRGFPNAGYFPGGPGGIPSDSHLIPSTILYTGQSGSAGDVNTASSGEGGSCPLGGSGGASAKPGASLLTQVPAERGLTPGGGAGGGLTQRLAGSARGQQGARGGIGKVVIEYFVPLN